MDRLEPTKSSVKRTSITSSSTPQSTISGMTAIVRLVAESIMQLSIDVCDKAGGEVDGSSLNCQATTGKRSDHIPQHRIKREHSFFSAYNLMACLLATHDTESADAPGALIPVRGLTSRFCTHTHSGFKTNTI
jgi:hypothetical protein